MIETCPELFPVEIAHGYVLHDKLPGSDKLPGVRFWRIMLNARDNEGKRAVLTVASSAVMPYMTSLTDDVDLVDRWRQVGADLVAFEFDASLDIPHNSVGPAADLAKKQLVYDRMLEPLGEQP